MDVSVRALADIGNKRVFEMKEGNDGGLMSFREVVQKNRFASFNQDKENNMFQ